MNIRLGLDLVWVGIRPKYIAGFEKRERRAGFLSYRESGIRQNLGTGSSGLPFPDPEPRVGGVLPYYKPYRYMPPQRVGFLSRFDPKTGIDFVHFCLDSGMVFEGTTRTAEMYERIYRFNSK